MHSQKIRVLQLGSPTGLYGAERWILALVNNIDKIDIQTIVAVILDDPNLNADICKEAEKIGVSTKIFKAYGKINWSAVRQLRKYIIETEVDILHTHGYKTDIIGLLAAQGTHCKLVTTPHGWSKNAGFKLKIYEAIDRFAFCFFDAIAPLSEEIYSGLKHFPCLKNKLRLIPNGVDIVDIASVNDIADEIVEWKANDYFIIGYIGQLIYRKGLDILLKALSKIDLKEWRLAIIGDGPEKPELVKLVHDLKLEYQVKFFGFRKDRISFLRGLDVFVLPSRLEGVPRCVMEAMATNVPVVASDIPGCRDLILQDITGLLFKPDDVDGLCRAISNLITDDVLGSRLATSAKKMVENNWSASAMANYYHKLYDELKNG